MTKKEKSFQTLLKHLEKIGYLKARSSVQDINKLLKQFKKMSQMMKKWGKIEIYKI